MNIYKSRLITLLETVICKPNPTVTQYILSIPRESFLPTNMSDNTNPGNFSNRPQEQVEDIARKGGQSSHSGGFASMDPSKQV
jgi:hypothetical protein